ncbi:hypothetical protein FISHEDRAFT_75765 [Fistulina hepatica ATCC 64428]|uniref:SMP-LTD domain-containing protein n=1 Tax=Fistulina hepatica ATCC 64428 TaxID=1128425 RepID=A0A0D7A8U6_9AGAR|nr:hypothetical protein FISHEDRAFT_75765 [Fistulina hepatica ATCC 64428]
MGFRSLLIAYFLGGLTFIPLLILAFVYVVIYTSVPVGETDVFKRRRRSLEQRLAKASDDTNGDAANGDAKSAYADEKPSPVAADMPRPLKGWLTVRHTYEEPTGDGTYVAFMRNLLNSRSSDPKRSRPKDMWYAVLKSTVLFLYEDESMNDCEAAIELGSHRISIFPENGLFDGELYAKRNAICLRPQQDTSSGMNGVSRNMRYQKDVDAETFESDAPWTIPAEKDDPQPWYIFVRSNVEMEDWYLALVHASKYPPHTALLAPLQPVFRPDDVAQLVSALDAEPDVIPMRWLNALLGRIFFSYYRTHALEKYIIGRLMKKLSKIKRPTILSDIVVTEVSVGDRPPMFSKPMLKELTKEGDAAMEVHFSFKGEVRCTVEATATLNLGARFKPYVVKLALAAVVKELEGNMLFKIKPPPSNRIWYAFTKTPRMVLAVEPIIEESVVLPNMDDIAFFDSQPYAYRGGIFEDAQRHESPPVITTEPEPDETTSIPVLDNNSTEERPRPKGTASVPESLMPTSEPSVSASPSNAQRRRTWFSSAPTLDVKSASELLSTNEGDMTTPVQRGRSREVNADAPSKSSPSPAHSQLEHSVERPAVEGHAGDHLDVQPRSPSRNSTLSEGSQLEAAFQSHVRDSSTRSEPGDVSESSSTSPSFLATLKSRAADKQTLSNTAKETIRKWGMNVNWGTAKHKPFVGSTNEEDVLDGSSAAVPRPRTESNNTMAQWARTSYAEVRAAVAERRERMVHNDDANGDRRPASEPIAIPKARDRVPGYVPSQSDTADEEIKAVPTAPIHVQPHAVTMSIPGIHAKHRGEVMSMGYVPPQTASTASMTENNKGQTIQSVYRLFKNPTTSASSTNSTPTPTPAATPPAVAQPSAVEAVASSAASSSSSASSASDKGQSLPVLMGPSSPGRMPPPLPPRSTPTSASADRSAHFRQNSGSDEGGASGALKSIATKSQVHTSPVEATIVQVQAETGPTSPVRLPKGPPPPLPPRRTSMN